MWTTGRWSRLVCELWLSGTRVCQNHGFTGPVCKTALVFMVGGSCGWEFVRACFVLLLNWDGLHSVWWLIEHKNNQLHPVLEVLDVSGIGTHPPKSLCSRFCAPKVTDTKRNTLTDPLSSIIIADMLLLLWAVLGIVYFTIA